MALNIGDSAPDFTLPSTSGSDFTLSKDASGKPCVLFFYPKNNTKVCTAEACSFRDQFSAFRDLDVDVFGISRDSLTSHEAFKKEHKLPFHLLSDKQGKVVKAYKVHIPIVGMSKRVTYLLDKNHKIVEIVKDMFDADLHIRKMTERIKML